MPVVAPSSAIMLQIVARWVTFNPGTPSPKNSNTRPKPPRTPRRRKSSRMMSLACTHGRSRPRSSTPTTRGVSISKGAPASVAATSSPPAPMAIIPRAPDVVVWLSAPTSSWPGRAKRSTCR